MKLFNDELRDNISLKKTDRLREQFNEVKSDQTISEMIMFSFEPMIVQLEMSLELLFSFQLNL